MHYEIFFTNHALYQMKERGISKSEIVLTVSNPDKTITQPQEKFQAIKLIKRNNKKYLLVVIYRKSNSFKKIITSFLTTKINKYL